jgi:hypothetical protein
VDCGSRVVITSDEGKRGGKTIATKAIVDAALKECPGVEHVLVLKRTGKTVNWVEGRDTWWHEAAAKVPAYCPFEIMSAEDPLFILYVRTWRLSSAPIYSLFLCRHPVPPESLRVSSIQLVDISWEPP